MLYHAFDMQKSWLAGASALATAIRPLRMAWRRLTSMRTALILLFLLALAAVPGSILPQRSLNPDKTTSYIASHGAWGRFLDHLGMYDVFGSVWFAAIYLLLFVSLVGCLVPRIRLHARASIRKPLPAPRNLDRLPENSAFEVADTADAYATAARQALGRRWRVTRRVEPTGAVLDAGCARYSTLLPSLRLYGFTDLFGNNLEWSRESRHGPVRLVPGDMTATSFPDARFDAITCLSVIEHGVPVKGFLVEAARLLKPGGVLFISTDYDQNPPDTTGKTAYGQPVHIFSPDEIRAIVSDADAAGLRLIGELKLDHAERPVTWPRVGIDYTFLSVGLRKAEK